MMTFPTGWKVIKFHGSKPPTSFLRRCPKIGYTHHETHDFRNTAPGSWLHQNNPTVVFTKDEK
jgi:hypothetical protein